MLSSKPSSSGNCRLSYNVCIYTMQLHIMSVICTYIKKADRHMHAHSQRHIHTHARTHAHYKFTLHVYAYTHPLHNHITTLCIKYMHTSLETYAYTNTAIHEPYTSHTTHLIIHNIIIRLLLCITFKWGHTHHQLISNDP